MAVYHASMMPPPDQTGPVEVDRKAAVAAVELVESPDQARARLAAGGAAPAHYASTRPLGAVPKVRAAVEGPYK
jgi:hypothetical protein